MKNKIVPNLPNTLKMASKEAKWITPVSKKKKWMERKRMRQAVKPDPFLMLCHELGCVPLSVKEIKKTFINCNISETTFCTHCGCKGAVITSSDNDYFNNCSWCLTCLSEIVLSYQKLYRCPLPNALIFNRGERVRPWWKKSGTKMDYIYFH